MIQTSVTQTATKPLGKAGAATNNKKQVVEGKKPGLKPGQKITAKPKLKPVQIEAIARAIEEHSLDQPATPITYAALEERFGYSAVTLRGKPPIRAAMESAILKATQSCVDAKEKAEAEEEGATTNEATIEGLRKELRELRLEVENYRRDQQLLTLYFHMRGETLSQVLAQANQHMSGTPTYSATNSGRRPVSTVNPISRK